MSKSGTIESNGYGHESERKLEPPPPTNTGQQVASKRSRQLLEWLATHPGAVTFDIAAAMWPGKKCGRAAHGGPTGHQWAASSWLSRLERQGLVRCRTDGKAIRYWATT